ncbi:MAG: FecR family protein [Bacteroidales bacterium]|nr:FecR family protein [Bacteroidales bacterium]
MRDNKNNLSNYKDLIIKFLTKEISEAELNTLNQWIEEHEQNRDIFLKLKQTWLNAGNIPASQPPNVYQSLDNLWNKIHEKQEHHNKKRNFYFRYRKHIAIAASWMLFFILGSVFSDILSKNNATASRASNTQTEIIAPLGSKCKVMLPDNTEVWLNAGSRIYYDITYQTTQRLVHLEGEAYFSVARQEDCPFRVQTSDLMVTALGTKFNVKAYPEEETITTTLEEGKIDVKLLSGKRKAEQIVLKPNDNIVFYRSDYSIKFDGSDENIVSGRVSDKSGSQHKVEIKSDVNTELYTSWKEDRWIFLGEPLPSLAAKLERRFNMRIVFAEELLRNYKFSGTIENETIEQILQALRLTAPLKYTIEKNTVVLSVDYQLVKKYRKIIKPKD